VRSGEIKKLFVEPVLQGQGLGAKHLRLPHTPLFNCLSQAG
jgi:hypothetical protein